MKEFNSIKDWFNHYLDSHGVYCDKCKTTDVYILLQSDNQDKSLWLCQSCYFEQKERT